MKKKFIFHTLILVVLGVLFTSCTTVDKSLYVKSKVGYNKIALSLNKEGKINYKVTRRDKTFISESSLGLKCDDQNFTSGLSVVTISPTEERREQYELKGREQ